MSGDSLSYGTKFIFIRIRQVLFFLIDDSTTLLLYSFRLFVLLYLIIITRLLVDDGIFDKGLSPTFVIVTRVLESMSLSVCNDSDHSTSTVTHDDI